MKTEKQQAKAAADFSQRWKGKGYEKGESQLFWTELLTEVFDVENPSEFIRYEEQVKVDKTNFIDGHIPATKVLIEQKSLGRDLRKGSVQSDGSVLNPFQQAKRYVANMPLSQHPRWVVACNFAEFLVYDMEQPNCEPEQILLENLGKEYYRLRFLVDVRSEHLTREMEVSMKAGEIVGVMYDALLKQYGDNSPETLRWLNILCVRLVFCLYAEDAGVFTRDQFHDYLVHYEADDIRNALIRLFEVLNTPLDKRSKYLKDDLKAFPYTNGGLFEGEIEIPQFTDELKHILLQNASLDFDWSEISPTIFGAVFESTLNPDTRRSGGMHYTSIENIHKVIDPLFLNDLRSELDVILEEKVEKQRQKKLLQYQDKLASLKFLDPACGSGNFLTETYLSLRRLENEAIRERYHGQMIMGEFLNPIKVSIHQFYGIEINDFAVTVATTALWISEAQMLAETEKIVRHDIDFLPLKSYSNIKEGNALRLSWTEWETDEQNPIIIAKKSNIYPISESKMDVVAEPVVKYGEVDIYSEEISIRATAPKPTTYHVEFDYIMGNPPFVGYSLQSKEQKDDLVNVCVGCGKNIDYVAGWYYKAAKVVQNVNTHVALVSTNSITQGEQVASIWKNLIDLYGIHIDFAYRTFRWDSEATLKAHVHCVVVGFSKQSENQNKPNYIFDNEKKIIASNINPYLIDAPSIFIGKRKKPISDVPEIQKGSIPVDDGNLIIEAEEYDDFIKREPNATKFIHKYVGAKEFLHNLPRYCLWLLDASPNEINQLPIVRERIKMTRNFRLSSTKEATRKYADFPTRFMEIRQPKTNYILIPSHSSEQRRYIPMGFMSPEIICSNANLMIPNATLYHFGVLESNVHMAWMRAVCGRLEMRYRYSNDIVYNNFPWPSPTDAQKVKIEQTAQAILDARAKYPNSSLADLYDELTMPPELRKAHQDNDRAVMQAYGFLVKSSFTESMCVAELFKLYQELTK